MLLFVICLVSLSVSDTSALHENYEADYFTNVSLPCNFTLHEMSYPGLLVPIKRYWVLPNSTVITDTFTNNHKFTIFRPTVYDFTLIVSGIDEVDFGIYECAMLWNNFDYKIDVIKIGLNVDGPYYKEKLDDFRSNVIVGGVIAGAVFATVVIGCMVCSCRYSRMSKEHSQCQSIGQSARLHSVYEYGSNPGIERTAYDIKQEQDNSELYAKVNKRGSLYECKRPEETGTQSVHF